MKRTGKLQDVKRYNISVSLYLMLKAPHSAKSISAMLGVSRQTAHNYINELLDCGFIKICGKGRYRTTKLNCALGNMCNGLTFDAMLIVGEKSAKIRSLEVITQYELWNGVLS